MFFSIQKNRNEKNIYIFNIKLLHIYNGKISGCSIFGYSIYKKEYNQNYILHYFLGIKIRQYKRIKNISKHINNIESICSYNLSTINAPNAIGYLRLIQKASIIILRDVIKVCNENDITYWLSFGAVLGAYRHNGCYIPWDDDIDICMLREDYNKFIKIYNEKCDKKFKSIYYTDEKGIYNFTKIVCDLNNVFIDIFPQDIDSRNISIDQKLNDINKIKDTMFNNTYWNKKSKDQKNNQYEIKKYHEHLISMQNYTHQEINNNTLITMGAECFIDSESSYCDAETIFPLQDITFEGCICKAPNDIEKYLYYMFGDFMNYPDAFNRHTEKNTTNKDMIDCLSFVRQYW